MSQSNWPCLNYIGLSLNRISGEGVKHLSKSNWSYLSKIILSTFLFLKLPIQSKTMDVSNYVKENGLICSILL